MRFARRTNWELTPNKISEILESFKASGESVLDLTESNPTRCGLAYPQDELLCALLQTTNMSYAPSTKGLLPAREAVAAYYRYKNIRISPEQIFLTASTSEAYSYLFRLLADPGDSILFPAPSYPLFDFLVDLNDLERRCYPLEYRDSWRVDFEGLEENLGVNTKALVTVNPNNPTGSYIKKGELARLNDICKARHCALISDEVFFDYAFKDSADVVSFAGNRENLTFTLGGVSKTLGLPQMKLSWMIVSGPDRVVEDAVNRLEIIADTYLSVNTPVQNALAVWFGLRSVIQGVIMDRVRANRDFLLLVFRDSPLGCLLAAEGGWYMTLKLNNSIDEEKFVEELLIKDHVYVHPGYFFNFSESCGSYLILSLLPLPEIFSEGVNRIVRRLQSFNSFS